MKIRDWLDQGRVSQSNNAAQAEKPQDFESRAALVDKTFEAVSMVGFLRFRTEELALGNRVTEDDRREYYKFLKQSYRPEFDAMVAKASAGQVQKALQWWIKEAQAKGLSDWQKERPSARREIRS